jgi:hypothetical protein
MKMTIKEKSIFVNWNDVKSIEAAERKKEKLENDGYILYHTLVGICTSTLIYQKRTIESQLERN